MAAARKQRKAKFAKGQVVAWKHGAWDCPEYMLIRSVRWYLDEWHYKGHREINERNLRPLTRRERGERNGK